MNDPTNDHHKGQLLIVTDGEYEDFHVEGLFVALKDFKDDETAIVFKAYRKTLPPRIRKKGYKFFSFLVEQGYIQEVDCEEYYLVD